MDSDIGVTIMTGVKSLQNRAESVEEFLEELYDEYAHSLFRYTLALTGSQDDAEDAVQEVLIRLARQRNLRHIKNLRAYLFTAARNAAYSILRSRQRRGEVEEPFGEDLVLEESGCKHESLALRQALSQLPVDQREVLVLKVFDGMTFAEIAVTTGVKVNTVASRYRYAIERLRGALEVDDGE